MKTFNVSDQILEDVKCLIAETGDRVARVDGKFIHKTCKDALRTAIRKIKKCGVCQKPLHKAPASKKTATGIGKVDLTEEERKMVVEFRSSKGVPIGANEIINAVHKPCHSEMKEFMQSKDVRSDTEQRALPPDAQIDDLQEVPMSDPPAPDPQTHDTPAPDPPTHDAPAHDTPAHDAIYEEGKFLI